MTLGERVEALLAQVAMLEKERDLLKRERDLADVSNERLRAERDALRIACERWSDMCARLRKALQDIAEHADNWPHERALAALQPPAKCDERWCQLPRGHADFCSLPPAEGGEPPST